MPQSLSFCIHVRFIVGLTFSARQGFIILINSPVWREHWCVSDACPFLFPSSLTLFFFLIHHYHVFLPTLPLTEGESPRLSRRMCSSCWARGHQSSGPPSLSGRPQTVQTSTEDRWPWAGAVEAAVKDSPLWRHRSSITTGHPVEQSRERSPGKKQGVELLQQRDGSHWMAQHHLSLHLLVFCLLRSLNMKALSYNTDAYFHTLTSCINWVWRLFHPASSFALFLYSIYIKLSEQQNMHFLDDLFGSFGPKSDL